MGERADAGNFSLLLIVPHFHKKTVCTVQKTAYGFGMAAQIRAATGYIYLLIRKRQGNGSRSVLD
jgi:hypothetical protein